MQEKASKLLEDDMDLFRTEKTTLEEVEKHFKFDKE